MIDDSIISVQNVYMDFNLFEDRVSGLKEFIVKLLKGEIKKNHFRALNNISFDVKKGEVLGVIGHNGAGKSTLLKLVAGLFAPTSGEINIKGNVVPMLELGAGFDYELTGHENIYLNGALLGFSKEYINSHYNEIVEFSELNEFLKLPIRNYSSGMLMRLAFSIASIIIPDVLIVDEILSVGDSNFQKKSRKKMLELMEGGTTVLFVSHSLEQIRELCSHVIWLDHGNIIMDGEAKIVCDAYEQSIIMN